MKQRRKIVFLALIIICVFVLSACSNSSKDKSPESPQEESYDPSDQERDTGGGEEGAINAVEDSSYNGEVSKEESGTGKPFDRKIIRNATLEMEAEDAGGLYKELIKYGNNLGGYEFSYDVSNDETYSVIRAVYKVPPEKLDQFMDFAGKTGRIINNTMSSEDITESYYDVTTRLESKRKSLDQYYKLLQEAKTIEEITKVQSIIDQITEEIEANEGKLKVWNSLVDMATVELYIRQENDPIKIKKEIHWNTISVSDMGYLIKNGLVSLLNVIVSLVQWIVIAVVITSPIWVAVGIVLWIYFKKRRKRRMGEKEEKK